MNTERLFKIILVDLSNDILKLESDLETTINSGGDMKATLEKIKELLSKIVATEASITKFSDLISKTNNNNNNPKTQENGNN